MALNPLAISLLLSGSLLSLFALIASWVGVRILGSWDIGSGSEAQLSLERSTYLVSTIMSYMMVLEFFSLLLFVFMADRIHGLFVGAMCAAGTLNANEFGYPALMVKTLNSILCGVWIVLNRLDNRGPDYPLIRQKYKFLMAITAGFLLELYLTVGFVAGLDAGIITSCCGTLFSSYSEGVAADLASLSPRAGMLLFFISTLAAIRLGVRFLLKDKGAIAFSLCSAAFFVTALMALISFISPYYYELPTHHCPFCILQAEYDRVGYVLYSSLIGGTIFGVSVGVLKSGRTRGSIAREAARMQRRCCVFAMVLMGAFAALSGYPMVFSDFRLEV